MVKYLEKIIRCVILGVGVLAEILFVYLTFSYFTSNYAWIEFVLRLMSILIVLNIVNNSRNLSTDMFWILLIVMLPIPGTIIYLLMGADLITSKRVRKLFQSDRNSRRYFAQDDAVLSEMEEKMPDLKGDFYYISQTAGYPFYRNTDFTYYPLGDLGFPAMLEALESAREFIFLEYFVIKEGYVWDSIHEILRRKAAEGVDVRVMYDDAGSILSLSATYSLQLEREGIKTVCFNRMSPVAGVVMNHRDHRKILVVDGRVAFSGGMNLADEYINRESPFGHWKDNCIRVQGEAVWSYTVLFLTNWNALRKTEDSYETFRKTWDQSKFDGYLAPYGGMPFDTEKTGQSIYANIINSANEYLYICTPYLMIDNDLENALILAAKKGVDVRILTPGIPDKKMIWRISRSYYANLIDGGVKVYEYTPGFNHAKIFVSDDRIATVGTFNLDFRSLYLHFENGSYLCDSKAVFAIRDDFLDMIRVSHLVEKNDVKCNLFMRTVIAFAKLFVSQM